jgi:glycosyltransferase involved in cell wall biosynthesis
MEGSARIGLFVDPTSGAEAHAPVPAVEELSAHLAALGHEVDLVSCGGGVEPGILYREDRVRSVRLPATAGAADEDPRAAAFQTRDAFLRFMAAEGARYDLLQGSCWLSGWVAVDLGDRLGLPAVVSLSGGSAGERPPGGARGRMVREVIERATRHIVPNLRTHVALVKGHGVERERVEVIPPGVDTDQFSPVDGYLARQTLAFPPSGFVAVYLGPTLDDADGAAVAAAVHRTGERLGAPIALHVLPAVGGNGAWERQMCYAASDVVIATSRHETAERLMLEAMACARPVIASAIDESSFALGEGVTGYLVPPRAPEDLAERLEQLLRQPELRRRMGQAARLWVQREYSWPMVARRLDAVYSDVLPASAGAVSTRM